MKRSMSILMALAVVVFGTGCPPMDDPEPTNSVSIGNSASDCSTNEEDIVAVEVTLSGSSDTPINLLAANDPIGSDEAQGFCCFADGVYDVTVRTAIDSATAFNNVFEGSITHSFLVRHRSGCDGNISDIRPSP